MRREERTAVWTGVFVLVSFVVSVLIIVLIGKRTQVFRSHYTLRGQFENVQALAIGATVRMAGVLVGNVSDIRVPLEPGQTKVVVYLSVESASTSKIRDDSVASIRSLGLLGDKYVEISMGSPEKSVVEEHGFLKTEEPADFAMVAVEAREAVQKLNRAATSIDEAVTEFRKSKVLSSIEESSVSLSNIVKGIEKGPGAIHTVIFDPEFKELTDNLRSASDSLRQIMDKGATKEGGVGEMLFGKDYETITRTTRQFVQSLDRVAYEIEYGEGLLHGLIYDPNARESLTEIRRAAERLDLILQDVQTGQGLLHGLIYDKEERETLVQIRQAATRLNNILDKIETGEGTAGLLINDPSVWEDMRRLLGGVERSKTLKFFIERSLKEGRKAEAEKPPRELQPAEEPPPAPAAP